LLGAAAGLLIGFFPPAAAMLAILPAILPVISSSLGMSGTTILLYS